MKMVKSFLSGHLTPMRMMVLLSISHLQSLLEISLRMKEQDWRLNTLLPNHLEITLLSHATSSTITGDFTQDAVKYSNTRYASEEIKVRQSKKKSFLDDGTLDYIIEEDDNVGIVVSCQRIKIIGMKNIKNFQELL